MVSTGRRVVAVFAGDDADLQHLAGERRAHDDLRLRVAWLDPEQPERLQRLRPGGFGLFDPGLRQSTAAFDCLRALSALMTSFLAMESCAKRSAARS